jgi:hypothetical protein
VHIEWQFICWESVIFHCKHLLLQGERKHVLTDLLNSLRKLFSKKLARCVKVTADMVPLYIINWLWKGYSNNGIIFCVQELMENSRECNLGTHIIMVHYKKHLARCCYHNCDMCCRRQCVMIFFLFPLRPTLEEIRSWGKSFDKLMRNSGKIYVLYYSNIILCSQSSIVSTFCYSCLTESKFDSLVNYHPCSYHLF